MTDWPSLQAHASVPYEMLTGRRPFAGDEVSDVLASVLAREPDLAALPATARPSIRRLLRRCLEKDRNERSAAQCSKPISVTNTWFLPTASGSWLPRSRKEPPRPSR